MLVSVKYDQFKLQALNKSNSIQYIITDYGYDLYLVEGDFGITCVVRDSSDIADFEANLKDASNKPLSDYDNSGRKITRQAVTEKGWHYNICWLERKTSTDEAIIEDREGNTRAAISVTRYDSQDNVTTISANVVKSKIIITFNHDIEIIEAEFLQGTQPTQRIRLFVTAAGHIPAEVGGSKTFLENFNIKHAGNYFHMDGRSSKFVKVDNTYFSHQWELIEKHEAGVEHEYMLGVGFYKE